MKCGDQKNFWRGSDSCDQREVGYRGFCQWDTADVHFVLSAKVLSIDFAVNKWEKLEKE